MSGMGAYKNPVKLNKMKKHNGHTNIHETYL